MSGPYLVVARDELRHQVRSPLFVVFLVLLGLLSLGMSTGSLKVSSGDTSVGGKVAWITSEVTLTYLFGVGLLLYLFFSTIAAGRALLRDEESGLMRLVAATPIGPDGYLVGKALGVLGAQVLAVLFQVTVQALLNHGLHDPATDLWVGPFVLTSYLMPALLVVIPTMTGFVALGLLLASIFRRPVAVYLVVVAILVISSFFLWSYRPSWLPTAVDRAMMIVDPFAMRWLQLTFLETDRGVDFYNHATVPWDATFVANRLALLAAIGGSLLGARRALRRSFFGATRSSKKEPMAEVSHTSGQGRPLAALGQRVRSQSWLRQLWTVAGFELRTLRRRPGIWIAPPLLVTKVVSDIWGREGVFGTEVIATAGDLAVRSASVLSTVVCLMSMFYLVESLHRERELRLDGIYFSAPVGDCAIVWGKVLANVALGLGIIAINVFAAAIAIGLRGQAPVEFSPLLLVWVVVIGPSLLLWNALVAAVYALTSSRYASYGAGLAVLAATIYAAVTEELNYVNNWALWGTLRWSDIGPFELDRAALIGNRVFVLLLAAFLLQLSVHGFRRRIGDPLGASAPRHHRRLVPLALASAAALFVTHRVVAAGPDAGGAKEARHDYWKAHHDTWMHAPTPSIAGVDLAIDLEPSESRFSVEGSYVVLNHHDAPMDRFAVTLGENFRDTTFTLDGEPYEAEVRAGLLVVERTLAPKQSVTLGFRYHGRHPDGSGDHGMKEKYFILPSGIVFNSLEPMVLPVLGYQRDIGVDPDHTLEAPTYFPGYHEGRLDPYLGSATAFHSRIAITGPADYTFNSVGELVEDEIRGHRRRVVWKSVAPIRFFNVVGGRWEVKRGNGAAVFYDARHPYNVDAMLEALEGARRHYGKWFGPYPYGELKLSEFAGHATYAQGFPSNINFSEGVGFLATGELNAAFTITAHEAAHQWWANRLTPGKGPGAGILAEALSHYSALLLLQEMRGDDIRQRFAKVMEKRYLENRRRDGERPLVEVVGDRSGDTTLFYDKGGLVFWVLMQQLGRRPLIEGLADMVKRYETTNDFPAVPDLLAVLRAHAVDPDAFDGMVKQLFHQVVLPEYQVVDAVAAPQGRGYRVAATIRNAGNGAFVVPVAVLGEEDGQREVSELLIPSEGEVALVTTTSFEPRTLVIDPDVHVLQSGRASARRSF